MNRTTLPLIATFAVLLGGLTSNALLAQADHIPWRTDLDQAKKLAAEEGKLILLHFSATWCAPCKEIERFVFVNPMAVRAIGNHVVPVKVDVDMQTHIAEEYGVSEVPYDVIVTAAGHVVTERSSPRSSDGYVQMIEQAKSGAAHLSDRVAREAAELRDEIRRQQQALAAQDEGEKSFGSLAASQANQFQSTYQSPPGFDVPKFENPKPWSEGNVTAEAPAAPAGVMKNDFVAPSGDFQVEVPAANSPKPQDVALTATFGGGQFIPPGSLDNKPAGKANSTGETAAALAMARIATADNAGGSFQPASNPLTSKPRVINRLASNPRVINPLASNPAASGEEESDAVADAAGPTEATAPAAVTARITNPMASASINRQPAAADQASDSKAASPPLGLEGYCSVTLMEQQTWTKGDRRWGCLHRGRLYLFASKEYRDRFRSAPDEYSPLLGGADPVDYHRRGDLVDGMRKHGVFYGEEDGPNVIVLFANAENRAKFEADPAEYLRTVRQAMSRIDGDRLLR
jgi:YHS domain-containing protein/thiol-disulfide isomerase/thioredoxin